MIPSRNHDHSNNVTYDLYNEFIRLAAISYYSKNLRHTVMFIEKELESKAGVLFNEMPQNMGKMLGIDFQHVAKDKIIATMPVDENTKQPFGLLHGGASAALAETLASVGAWFNIDESKNAAVGIELNANHIRSVRSGIVTGTAAPIQRGAQIHVWEIRIFDEKDRLVCVSRCTLAIIKLRHL